MVVSMASFTMRVVQLARKNYIGAFSSQVAEALLRYRPGKDPRKPAKALGQKRNGA